MKKLEQLMAERAALDAEIEKLQNAGKRWRGLFGYNYWVVDSSGEVYESDEGDIGCDLYRFSVGNYHKTEADALAWRERQIATQQIKDRIAELNAQQGWVADWMDENQIKYSFYYDAKSKKIKTDSGWTIVLYPTEFYGSKETIETVIKEMAAQIKLWLGIN